MRIILIIYCFLFLYPDLSAQNDTNVKPPVADTVVKPDTIPKAVKPAAEVRKTDTSHVIQPAVPVKRTDSVSKRPMTVTGWQTTSADTIISQNLTGEILFHHPWLGFSSKPEVFRTDLHRSKGKEDMFYVMICVILLFAILRQAFPKYFNDLFRLFFRTTMKQRQIREQLMQTPLPSLLMNGFFVITAGFYLAFVLVHYNINPFGNFWILALYCGAGIAVAYLVKFIGLRLTGAIFGVKGAATSYIFVVFIVNKMIGMLLLPFLVLLAFTTGALYSAALYLSFLLLIIMLFYRFILTFAAIRNQIRVNPFHFLLYILAFEVAPLLLVYRVLLIYFPEIA